MVRSTLAVAVVALVLATGCGSRPVVTGGSGGSGDMPGGSGGTGGQSCDQDADGFLNASCGGADCNDRNADIYPGAAEICGDNADDNCDGHVDEECSCTPGDRRHCYPDKDAAGATVDPKTANVGACIEGEQSCQDDGKTWTACIGAVTPSPEGPTCDGIDQDCDGKPDKDLTNACGVCGPLPAEICGNGLDDDCDGLIDDPSVCTVSCAGVDLENPPPGLECCFKSPDGSGLSERPVPFSYTCVDDPDSTHGMAACMGDPSVSRPCLNLLGDGASCERRCVDDNKDGVLDRCLCGLPQGPVQVPAKSDSCGFPTACAHATCDGRENQPCYSGPPQTLGKGICHGGSATCSMDQGSGQMAWGSCDGEQLPGAEVCGNGEDDDCDGLVDEEDALTGKRCTEPCAVDAQELCGDEVDNDCNGFVDEGCLATAESQACYAGSPGTRSVGACLDGIQHREGKYWGDCVGSVGPQPEKCGDGIDSDCNGYGGPSEPEDVGCCVPSGIELCDGLDNDCDGLIDEGVTSACGKCGSDACYTEDFHEPANCAEGSDRVCNRILPDPNNPDAFTLAANKQTPGASSVIYIAVTSRNQVAKLDTITGQKLWQVATLGGDPSRTAVPLDNSVWVANRGFSAEEDPEWSNVVHLDRDGNVICRAPAVGIARALCIDLNGDVWVGSFNHPRLYKFAGNTTSGVDSGGYPICASIDISPDDPANDWFPDPTTNYGCGFDDRGIMWTSSLDTNTLRLDTNTMSYDVIKHTLWTYGMSVDSNGNGWFGGGGAHEIDANGPYVNAALYEHDTAAPAIPVTVAHDGFIWASGGNTLSKVDPLTYQVVGTWSIPAGFGSDAHGIAEDSQGKIWNPMMNGGRASRFDPVTEEFQAFDVDPGQTLYTYSDMTGSQLRNFVARQGTWTQIYDSAYASTDWKKLEWTALQPKNTVIEVHARFANTRAGLDTTSTVCGPYSTAPVDLDATCPNADRNRFAAIEVAMRSARDGSKPTVGNVRLSWSRP